MILHGNPYDETMSQAPAIGIFTVVLQLLRPRSAAVGRGPWFSGDVRWAHQKLRGFDQELYWDILVGGYHGDIVGCTNRMMLRCGQGIPSSWPLSPAFTLGYRSFSSASRQARHSFIQIDDVPMTNSWYPSIVIMCTSI